MQFSIIALLSIASVAVATPIDNAIQARTPPTAKCMTGRTKSCCTSTSTVTGGDGGDHNGNNNGNSNVIGNIIGAAIPIGNGNNNGNGGPAIGGISLSCVNVGISLLSTGDQAGQECNDEDVTHCCSGKAAGQFSGNDCNEIEVSK